MNEVPEQVYVKQFEIIFDWFKQNVHGASEDDYTYKIIELPGTHYKMIDIIRDQTNGVYFRVIIKATYEDVAKMQAPRKDYRDLGYLFNTKTDPVIASITSTQVCIVQLNGNGVPVNGMLFTYSSNDEQYHPFPI